MAEERKQTYSIRVPEQVAARLEQTARTHSISPTALIQSVIIRKFRSPDGTERETHVASQTALAARLEALRKSLDVIEREGSARFGQLQFEIVKTRSALFHSLDQTLGAAVVDQIIEASDQTAREYVSGLSHPRENKS